MTKKGAVPTYLFLFFFTIIMLFPIYWMILASIKREVDLFSIKPLFIFAPTFEHYLNIFKAASFRSYFKNSLITSVCSTLLSLLISVPSAYALGRAQARSKETISLLILAGRMLPPVSLVIPLYLLMRFLGLLNSLQGIIIVHTTLLLPFSIWLLRSYFLSIPIELEESAYIDGAGRFKLLVRIVLPLALPGVLAVSIFSFIVSWNEFLFANTLSSTTAAQTLPVGVAGFRTPTEVFWGVLTAAGTMLLIPGLIFSIFMQKFFSSSLFAGALK